jgi:NAD(P)-dependent dehydrogenase (short-subunit alcohol dehydrogenase family)
VEPTTEMGVLDLFRLRGEVALVTGAHKWLGNDIAVALAEAGASIIVTSRDASRAAATAARIRADCGVEALGVELDQRLHDSVVRAFAQSRQWKGRIDVLVNNAGGGSGVSEGHILRRPAEAVEDMIRTNLTGVLYCCQEAGRIMAEQGYGKIINIASIAGLIGRDRRMYERSRLKGQPVDYAAAKAGVIGLTRDLAASLAPYGVRVNAISPGGFEKPGELPDDFLRDYADETMLSRWGKMGCDIKGAALFLASAASDYVTGHNLVVDGGFSVFK